MIDRWDHMPELFAETVQALGVADEQVTRGREVILQTVNDAGPRLCIKID